MTRVSYFLKMGKMLFIADYLFEYNQEISNAYFDI